jgi:ABC-2 type transport system permease protein
MGSAHLLEMLGLIVYDLVFLGLLTAALILLAMYRRAAYAVMKRNFVGYFSNPTGYVFLCLFVLLTSIASFWPHEFFVANLANLDQLNTYIPWILLIFIPAITMSIWAEERRQGTDELLLTLPAADFDIVIGKYLAAAAIFTVSLLFSQVANFTVLVSLTYDQNSQSVDIDTGLFLATYFGYWLLGLSMLAIGMVASFLTNNLTVSFILGLIFNSILVLTNFADTFIPSSSAARQFARWSFTAQLDDFGRGVVSFSAVAFFALVTTLGIYLSMVLIGKRHWSGGRDGQSLWWHYLLRVAALVIILVGLNVILEQYDFFRPDFTRGQVSSLSPATRAILRKLEQPTEEEKNLQAELAKLDSDSPERARKQQALEDLQGARERPIVIDAYISANVPEEYVKTRYTLVSMLNALKRQAGSRIRVNLHDNLEPFSEVASQAEERFKIRKQRVVSQSRGAIREEEFILGAAFTSGRESVVVPFFGNGVPVEYELIRSIATVSRGERKRLGVVTTDAQLMGGMSMQGMQPRQIPKQLILEELEKQYKVEEVDPTNPIPADQFDVLLVVQPSSLGPQQLFNVVQSIKQGQPAVIFEDAMPQFIAAPGTADPKPPQGMFGMGGPPPEKGDIRALWDALGIAVTGDTGSAGPVPATIVWQAFNPYPKIQAANIGPEWIFVRNDAPGSDNAINQSLAVTAGFEELLLPFATGIQKQKDSSLSFTELVSTSGELSGTVSMAEMQAAVDPSMLATIRKKSENNEKFVLAAWIRSNDKDAEKDDQSEQDKQAAKGGESQPASVRPLNVIYVADIDLLDRQFVTLRNQPNPEFNFRFDNVPFVLNLIDAVAGDERFLEIRTRKPRHSTLRMIEQAAADDRQKQDEELKSFSEKFEQAEKKLREEEQNTIARFQDKVSELDRKRASGEDVNPAEYEAAKQQVLLIRERERRKAEVQIENLRNERDRDIAASRRTYEQEVQRIQNDYKLWAALIPPIPPLLVGIVVWVLRRIREREGVSRTRRK